ncbi:MAG: ABC transporter permease [Clostridia bacterium]|nr:ABC transporter permease [Clostridia bacterium]
MSEIKDKQVFAIGVAAVLSFLFLPLVRIKPNRIAMGDLVGSIEMLSIFSIIFLILWATIIALSFYTNKRRYVLLVTISILTVILLLAFISIKAKEYMVSSSARVSFSSGFYLQILWAYLIMVVGYKKIEGYKAYKFMLTILPIILIYFGIKYGTFNDLSLMKEFITKRSQFFDNLRIHGILTLASVLAGIIIAVPLGYIAYKSKKSEERIMLPMSIIETIPSLSLFGILLIPLSRLGKLPIFNQIGVSGIGWAPAFVALSLYTLLPIGRNTLSGFSSVDNGIKEAAKGMGMKSTEILLKIEFPLAFPVIFTGVRIAFTQTIGGAVLAGLVGGGGMGSFVFLGLAEASQDLILLGVIPIVLLTIIVDYLLKFIGELIRGAIYD